MTDFATAREMMVDCQVRPSDVTKYPIIAALLAVPREEFVPQNARDIAYAGEHLTLAPGRVLLDARTFAKMLDALNIGPDALVLDLGCGYGYSSAIMAHMAEAVIAVEGDETLAEEASSLLSAQGIDNAMVHHGPLSEGCAKHGPYDAIVLQGSIQDLPDAIASQLKDGGKIAAIYAGETGSCCRIGLKTGERVHWRNAFDASAPLLEGFKTAPGFAFN